MSKPHLLIGTMLVGTLVVTACQNSGTPSNEETSSKENTASNEDSVTTPPLTARAIALSDTPSIMKAAWPNVDIVLIKDYAAARGPAAFKMRIHMDVPLTVPPGNLGTVEGHLNNQNGARVLAAIMNDLGGGTPPAWRTLKAALNCDDATLVEQNSKCTRRPPVTAMGSWPIPDMITLRDWEGVRAAPVHAVRVHMDLDLKKGQPTFDEIDGDLNNGHPELVLGHLAGDGAIKKDEGNPAGWATLKAALGCAQFDRDPAHC